MENNRPKIGVDVIVRKGNEIILLERKNNFGEWTWCLPGGHLEFGEEIIDCAKREVKEETALDVNNVKTSLWLNNIFKDSGKHYVTFYVEAEGVGGAKITEPEKFRAVQWFGVGSLPEKLFPSLENLVNSGYFK